MATIAVVYSNDDRNEYQGDSFVISGDWLTILDGDGKATYATRLAAHASEVKRIAPEPRGARAAGFGGE
jgi:hypothetical protein